MRRLIFVFLLTLCLPAVGSAQGDWRPPTDRMPLMPRAAEIRGDWLGPRADWFRGLDGVAGVSASGLRASGDPRGGSEHVQIARFTSGPLPVVIWSDRNSDDRADIIEIFRSGGVIIQVIDADYDGSANVIRTYDSDGELVRQERL
jgi:hypothetical protein